MIRRGSLYLVLMWAVALAARADERILAYDVDLRIAADGALTVAESIRVRAEGQAISRGIYRDFPTLYRDRYGNRVRVPFEVVEVRRDGRPEPWHDESIAFGKRLYVGAEDVFLTPGVYDYTLVYRTDRQLGYFEKYDEIYWNATGNGWAFPIDHATATVHLPAPVPAEDLVLAAYTGAQGARGTRFRASVRAAGVAHFETTAGLDPYEGLTVVVGFPKGVVPEPTVTQRRIRYARDNVGLLLGIAGVVGVLLWYAFAWTRVGRDPDPGAIYPRYQAPEGYSPGMLRYIWKAGYDKTAVAAALVEMAIGGELKLEEDDGTWAAERGDGAPATGPEKILHRALFRGGERLEFKRGNHARVGGAVKAYQRALSTRLEVKYFKHNRLWCLPGVLLSLLAAGPMVILAPTDTPGVGVMFALFALGWNASVGVQAARVVDGWRQVRGVLTVLGAAFQTLFLLPFLVIGMALIGFFGWNVGVMPAAVLITLVVVNVIFYQLMKAPTLRGRRMLDAIEGLRLYLGVAERQDLEARHGDEPPRTVEEFERLLPYAVALDAADTWAARFEDAIRAAETDGSVQGRSWYAAATSGGRAFSASTLGSSLAGGLAGGVAGSARAPGSSSGGGGGSSGGGGGGGGGGGW